MNTYIKSAEKQIPNKDRSYVMLWMGAVVLIAAAVLGITAGTSAFGLDDVMKIIAGNSDDAAESILFGIRIPRVAAAFFCGAGLSVSGLLLQNSLNNTLVSPGIIGINSGAGLFVLLGILLLPYSIVLKTAMAFAGAVLTALAVYAISVKAGVSKTSLILAGVAVSSFMGAGIDIIITVWPHTVADKVAFGLGGFQNVSAAEVQFAVPVIIVGILAALLLSGGIDVMQLGDETAHGLGLNVRSYRLAAVLCAALLAAASVSICGLLGFVGLIIPNLIRVISKNKCRMHILLCTVWGGGFLLICDILARVAFFPYEIPVGLFLSCIGAPFFIFILIKRKRRLEIQ